MLSKIIPAVAFAALLLLTSCSNAPDSLHGAWLGEGKFNAARGSMDVRAQVEFLPDGSYRFLVLEPGILALAGVENGKWTQNGDIVDLIPNVEEPGEQRSVLFGSAPRNFQPKLLLVESGLRSLKLDDGPMQITFKHNPEATAKLREAGEL